MSWVKQQENIFEDARHGKGNTVVEGVPGCGKTTTLVAAVSCVPRSSKLLVTSFGRDIVQELSKKITNRKQPRIVLGKSGVQVGTVHSLGFQLLKAAARIPLKQERTEDRTLNVIREFYRTHDQDLAEWPAWLSALDTTIRMCKATLTHDQKAIDELMDKKDLYMPFRTTEQTDRSEERRRFCIHVEEILELSKTIINGEYDYADMQWLPVVLNLCRPEFERIFVDETQDLDPVQIELLCRVVYPEEYGGRIMAVGDPRQAIYGFRGADERTVQKLIERLNAKRLPLSISFRCAQSIVNVARQVCEHIEAAPDAPEGRVAFVELDALRHVTVGDLIVSRCNSPLITLAHKFMREGKAVRVLGRKEVGKELANFVERSNCYSTSEFVAYVHRWTEKENRRLTNCDPPRSTEAMIDKSQTLLRLADGCSTAREIVSKIYVLFKEDNEAKILLGNTHRVKGLEAERVWMLEDTYLRRPGIEEENCWYVAVTRAKRELYRVRGFLEREEAA